MDTRVFGGRSKIERIKKLLGFSHPRLDDSSTHPFCIIIRARVNHGAVLHHNRGSRHRLHFSPRGTGACMVALIAGVVHLFLLAWLFVCLCMCIFTDVRVETPSRGPDLHDPSRAVYYLLVLRSHRQDATNPGRARPIVSSRYCISQSMQISFDCVLKRVRTIAQ